MGRGESTLSAEFSRKALDISVLMNIGPVVHLGTHPSKHKPITFWPVEPGSPEGP